MKKGLLRAVAALTVAACLTAGSAWADQYQLLQQGNKSAAVKQLQQALASLGYDPGTADGKFGAYTENAVRHFQRDYGLKVDGLAGEATQRLLYAIANDQAAATKAPVVTEAPNQVPTRTLRQGATGNDVRTVQLRLQALGYYQQTPNAMYDHDTVTAVTMFQFYNGLTADGVAGSQTYVKLFSSGAIKAPGQAAATAVPTATPTPAPTAVQQSQFQAPSRTLRKGSQGDDVLNVQLRLQQLGYQAGPVGGLYDAGTVEGVRAFQSRNGLTADGVAGSKTYAKLFSANAVPAAAAQVQTAAPASPTPTAAPAYTVPTRTLRRNYTGSDVTTVQRRLQELGYAAPLTGVYDDATMQAVRMFQLYNNLSADGVAGSKTYAKLFAANAVHAPAANTATPVPTATPTPTPTPVPTQNVSAWQIPTRTLVSGSTGDDVRNVQQRLSQLGYFTTTITGEYNAATVAAVKSFQSANRLSADGKAGPATNKVLFSENAIPAYAAATPTIAPVVDVPSSTTYATLSTGSKGDAVTRLQNRLKALGYTVNVTGTYDSATSAAVRAFQTNNYLSVDGVAGSETQTTLYSDAARTASQVPNTSYTTLSVNTSSGSSAVKEMQNRLQALGYPVTVNGTYDGTTHNAVVAFQQRNGQVISGIANGATLSALYSSAARDYSTPVSTLPADTGKMSAPGNVQLLWWYDDVKTCTKSGQTVLVFDPNTNISFNIKFYSMGKHADSQPATWQDTQLMNRSFGKTSWDCHPVYVRLPDGRWTLAAMHNYPHLYGSINDNGFGGHLCIHFLRTYAECRAAGDTNYGVQMQDAIRKHWKALTGITVE